MEARVRRHAVFSTVGPLPLYPSLESEYLSLISASAVRICVPADSSNSQPFWGDMVAAAGAGPAPIPHKSLDVSQLVEAIQYCLTPQAAAAAEKLATQMRSESGVQQAVMSFHSNLPRDMLECHVIKGQPAAWTYSSKRARLRLSKAAAEVLLSHLKVDMRCLEM